MKHIQRILQVCTGIAVVWLAAATAFCANSDTALQPSRWPASQAWRWYSSQPWLVGFNYIPASAINTTEMWQADTFDAKTIDAELSLAEAAGFNCARVFVQYLVWENDAKGLERRIEQFLSIAKKHGIRTLFVLFDECAFSTMTEPFLGKQPDVIPGEYANGWTPSPGPKRVLDHAAWPKLEAYVGAVVGRFRDDPRVLGWDVYNEPSNTGMGDKSLPLVEAAFAWARQAHPSQPLTAGVWGGTPESTRVCLELSDVISFHSYAKGPELERKIAELRGQLRPILCTEWLNRPLGSVVDTCLPVLARQGVGAFHWGLVNGKTQTQFPWGSKAGAPEPKVWQHDLFRKDRTPYDEKELALFRKTIRQATSNTATNEGQWPAAKAWAWHSQLPWLVGCNFLPSTAVNDVEMWQKESFDPKTIERELGWAQDLGFNTVRVFVNYAVWEADAAGLKGMFRQFLDIADQRGISALVILFDDCFQPEPRVGQQAEPEPGVHNSQWVQSPGAKRRGDPAAWPELEKYVKDMVSAFASDKRVLAWELYNEPSASLPLVEAAFRWAREARPTQPVTTTIFGDAAMQKRIIELSDVLCFHNYGPLPGVKAEVARLLAHGRPVLCTEWMARGGGSRFETHLPFFEESKIACWNWGLVAGRTQTYFPWGSPKGAPEPKLWHHDLLRADGTPFKAGEVRFIKVTTGRLPASALPRRKELVPTAEKSPVPWRYTLEKPAGDWFKADFNDAAWKQGAAPFGREETPIARQPNTVWTSADIWVRREFEMPAGQFTGLALRLHHDEDAEVYINGVMAVNAGGYNAAYEPFDITPEARAALKPGTNTLAVHSHQTIGGQYLDLGIEGVAGVTLESLLGEMTDYTAVARWPQPEFTCKQASSYDRGTVAPDQPGWFANSDQNQFIRTEENQGRKERVMLDADGPGCIVRVWLTTDRNKKGTLRFYLDGAAEPALVFPAYDLLSGDLKIGPPLAQPHPGYRPDANGGNNFYLPIPYATHCKVTWEEAGQSSRYYQINYRTYAPGTAVQTLTRAALEAARPAVERVNKDLLAPPDEPQGRNLATEKEIVAGGEHSLQLPSGPSAVRRLELRVPMNTLAFSERALRSLIVQMSYDGEPTVWCPVSDFFGSGVGLSRVENWYRKVETNGTMICRWVMPYQNSARITLLNLAGQPIKILLRATVSPWSWDDRSMHFHATWRYEAGLKTPPHRDWNFVRLTGRGLYVGDTLALFNPIATWYGEGDEKIWVDGESFPSHVGTGTEDYYGYSYAPKPVHNTPFCGEPRIDQPMTQGHNTSTRTRNLDGIPFRRSLQFDMELISWQPTTLTYAATTYWYAFPGTSSNVQPQPREAARPVPTLADAIAANAPRRKPGAIECEKMNVLAKSGDFFVGQQDMGPFGGERWSSGRHLLGKTTAVGDSVEIEFAAPDAEPRKLVLHATQAPDYATLRFQVNGQDVTKAFDGYAPGVQPAPAFVLGTFEPRDGKFKLRAEVAGANPASKGAKHFWGLDYVILERP